MTCRDSHSLDNGGRCESCDDPATVNMEQRTYPVRLGGGIGMGTMWLCPKCYAEHEQRDKRKEPDE